MLFGKQHRNKAQMENVVGVFQTTRIYLFIELVMSCVASNDFVQVTYLVTRLNVII
jgi:hypothetical protein